jgi:hypothetical protein
MTNLLVVLLLAIGAPSGQVRVPTGSIKTPAVLAEKFEVLSRFSFTGNRLGSSFTVGADGGTLYFAEGRASENTFDLMAIPIAGGAPHAVVALCGPGSPLPDNEYCNDSHFVLESVPGAPSRLIVAAGDPVRCCEAVSLLDLNDNTARPMRLGVSRRHAMLQRDGISPNLMAHLHSASPSGRYLLSGLYVYDTSGTYDDQYFAIFSLQTGKREFIFRKPTESAPHEVWDAEGKTRQVVGEEEAVVGWWDAWWEPSDILVLRHRGGSGEKVLGVQAFQRDASGTWHTVAPAAYERHVGWSHTPNEDFHASNYALVGRDPNGQGGYVIEGSVLFGSDSGLLYVIEFEGKAIVVKVHHSGIESRVEGVVLRQRASPAAS